MWSNITLTLPVNIRLLQIKRFLPPKKFSDFCTRLTKYQRFIKSYSYYCNGELVYMVSRKLTILSSLLGVQIVLAGANTHP